MVALLRTDAGIAVERAEPDPDRVVRVVGVAAVELAAARRAEGLGEAALGRPRGDVVAALRPPEAAGLHARLGRRGGPGAALAAGAVAVGGADQRLADLVADGAA